MDHVDLEVQRGEIFGLLGPNGAGKTTTVGMLTTRVVPTSGSILIDGVDIIANPVAAKQIVGVVSQQNTLDRSLDVTENLYMHGRYFGMNAKAARAEAVRLLEQFRLTDRASASVDALSGGMAQRLMVARAIMHKPQILFLDEPTAGLDPQSRIALWEILRELHDIGQTIMLTTHYMEEADQLCNRVAIMDHGKLLAIDTPTALKGSLGADSELRLVPKNGSTDSVIATLKELDGVTSVHSVDHTVYVQLKESSGAMLPRIFAYLESSNLEMDDVSITVPSLESVFINLTGKELRE